VTAAEAWDRADRQLRLPHEVLSDTPAPAPADPKALTGDATGPFWDLLAELAVTLLVTREYEHLLLALSADGGRPLVTALRLPHPSGLAVDPSANRVYVACTRNPNQVVELAPAEGWLPRRDRNRTDQQLGLVPVATRLYPGCLYLHDLAFVGDRLMGNAVGMNAVVDLSQEGVQPVWWPRSVETSGRPDVSCNLIQLNSIGAAGTLADSWFTASTARPGATFPGDPDWDIEGRGVIFSGRTREPVVSGLTRPHSVRVAEDGTVWVADSGFGTFCRSSDGRAEPVVDRYAVVGTSRVIPRFRRYAPGLDLERSRCGVHVVDRTSGDVTASLTWSDGNQIFAVDWLPSSTATALLGGHDTAAVDDAWYRFSPPGTTLAPTLGVEP
jgi:hypothetical protein